MTDTTVFTRASNFYENDRHRIYETERVIFTKRKFRDHISGGNVFYFVQLQPTMCQPSDHFFDSSTTTVCQGCRLVILTTSPKPCSSHPETHPETLRPAARCRANRGRRCCAAAICLATAAAAAIKGAARFCRTWSRRGGPPVGRRWRATRC